MTVFMPDPTRSDAPPAPRSPERPPLPEEGRPVRLTPRGRAKALVTGLLERADVHVGGRRPQDLQVHHEDFYRRVVTGGSLALGESYMDGWWDCDAIDELIYRVRTANLAAHVRRSRAARRLALAARLLNLQRRSRAFEVGERHYDLGNDLFEAMLDPRMVYTCGYWKRARTLEEAQEAKLDLICRKLGLRPGMRVLDVGCGWGSFARYAAEQYGASVVGITISREQVTFAKARCEGLPVEIRLQDYRALDETFDRIASVGMFEHVGYKNYRTFMETMRSCLKPEGLFLLHTIGNNVSQRAGDPWVNRYIFPNGMIPSAAQISAAAEGRFVIEDWHNFGADYDRTAMAWHRNFTSRWDRLRSRYTERFYRMWTYNLLTFAGTFRARRLQLWQIVLSGQGVPGGHESVR